MRKLLILLLLMLTALTTATASLPANPADPEMIAALLPGYTYVKGIDDGDELRLLLRRPDGALVFVGGVKSADGEWVLTESTPLPEGTFLGVENFTHSLGLPTDPYVTLVGVKPYADGTWGVSMLEPPQSSGMSLDKHCIHDANKEDEGFFGDHPWSDITAIDWTSLPNSYEEAIAMLDVSHWMVVNNPDPADRLHLRTNANRNSDSLGKYYNRTPVYIRQYGSEWCAVTVGGVDGWMMTNYLVPASEIATVDYAGPWLSVHGDSTPLCAAADASSEFRALGKQERFYVFGVVGDEWYHIWLPVTEEYGYVRQDALWPGNG